MDMWYCSAPYWLYLAQLLFLSQTQELQIRRYSPFLEKASLSSNGALVSDEWKAVPDIWRSSAENYGDRVALVDQYHDPPSTMTYKQVNFTSILLKSYYETNYRQYTLKQKKQSPLHDMLNQYLSTYFFHNFCFLFKYVKLY